MTEKKESAEFNDDELQEIMGEIESLEESFGEDVAADSETEQTEELDLKEAERQLAELEGDLEEPVAEQCDAEEEQVTPEEPAEDQELMCAEETTDEIEEEVIVDHEEHNVVTLEQSKTGSGNVVLGAEGPMNLSLNFSVAGKSATLKIEDSSLYVVVEGVHFHISEEKGCVFEMPGGVKFQVPLNSEEKVFKAS